MIENTLLNKSGVRPAGDTARRGHSNKQQNNINNSVEEKGNIEMGECDIGVSSIRLSMHLVTSV